MLWPLGMKRTNFAVAGLLATASFVLPLPTRMTDAAVIAEGAVTPAVGSTNTTQPLFQSLALPQLVGVPLLVSAAQTETARARVIASSRATFNPVDKSLEKVVTRLLRKLLEKLGNAIAAKIATMAIVTSNSIKVTPRTRCRAATNSSDMQC